MLPKSSTPYLCCASLRAPAHLFDSCVLSVCACHFLFTCFADTLYADLRPRVSCLRTRVTARLPLLGPSFPRSRNNAVVVVIETLNNNTKSQSLGNGRRYAAGILRFAGTRSGSSGPLLASAQTGLLPASLNSLRQGSSGAESLGRMTHDVLYCISCLRVTLVCDCHSVSQWSAGTLSVENDRQQKRQTTDPPARTVPISQCAVTPAHAGMSFSA